MSNLIAGQPAEPKTNAPKQSRGSALITVRFFPNSKPRRWRIIIPRAVCPLAVNRNRQRRVFKEALRLLFVRQPQSVGQIRIIRPLPEPNLKKAQQLLEKTLRNQNEKYNHRSD